MGHDEDEENGVMGGGAHVRYYTMEYSILVTKAILASSELAEVASSIGYDRVE